MSYKTEYQFKCGCRREDYTHPPGSPSKICPEHGAGMRKTKFRWCDVCGNEYECSTKSCRIPPICPDCKPGYTVKVQEHYRRTILGQKKRVQKFRERPNPKPVKIEPEPVDVEEPEIDKEDGFGILDTIFPPIQMPVMSPELESIISRYSGRGNYDQKSVSQL